MTLEDFERETSIWYNKADKLASLSTFNKPMITKMDKLCKSHPSTYKVVREIIVDGKVEGKEYSFDKKLVNVRQPSSRKLTEKEKKEAGKRLNKNSKKSN